VPLTDLNAPTTFLATNPIPDVTSDVGAATDTSLPAGNASNGASSGGFLHNAGAVAGTFTVVGVVVAGLAILFIVSRVKKRRQGINISEEDDDYVVNDRSGRTGFMGVNYGNTSVAEMSERQYGDQSYVGNDVEHTLGQEIIQQAPFDPFHNNFAFLDDGFSPDHHPQVPPGTVYQQDYQHGDYDNDLQVHEERLDQQTPWASHHANAEPDIPFRYEQHPYAIDAVYVTPLHRQPSVRAEYGLAC